MSFVPPLRRFRHALIVAALLTLTTVVPTFAATPSATTAARIVCVDAGHGGSDSGASYGGLLEKTLTLDIANRLGTLLRNGGFNVVMTRTGDTSLGNTDRANICNAGGADTVVSIHLNASSDPNVDYFKAFYGKRIKDKDFTQTIWNKYQLSSVTGSGTIQKSAPTQFASGLLLKTNAPATLAETVFLSNVQEQSLLRAGTRQPEIAQNLYDGIVAWYNRP